MEAMVGDLNLSEGQNRSKPYLIIVADAVSVNFFGRCKFLYRFNAKNWHFLQILRGKVAFFGVNFILQKFCQCKKMTNIRYDVNLTKCHTFHTHTNITGYSNLALSF